MRTDCASGGAGAWNSVSATIPFTGSTIENCAITMWVQQQMQSSPSVEVDVSVGVPKVSQLSIASISHAYNSAPVISSKNIAAARNRV